MRTMSENLFKLYVEKLLHSANHLAIAVFWKKNCSFFSPQNCAALRLIPSLKLSVVLFIGSDIAAVPKDVI